MQSVIRGLKMFDNFGVPLNLKVDSRQQFYKSVLGGITTLVIYTLSLIYAFYIMYKWQTYSISPKMSQTPYMSPLKLDLEYNIIDIYYWMYAPDLFDPFQTQNNILTPLLQSIKGGKVQYVSLLNQSYFKGKQRKINLNLGINVYNSSGLLNDATPRTILIARCQSKYLNPGESRASEQMIDDFMNQSQNLIVVNINSKLLNQYNQPQNSSYTSYFYVEPSLMYSFNADLKTNTYDVKEGLFIDSGNIQEYLSGQTIYGQTNTIAFSKQAFDGISAYGTLYITLQPLQTQIVVEYPHIGELLAQIGSVASVLFILKYLIAYLNYDFMWQHVVDQMISYYYPQFAEIKIEYNFFRQIKSVQYKNQSFEVENFKKFHKQLSERIQTKLTFNNIIYELSRLYMIIRSIQSQVEIRKCHNVGIDFDISRLQKRNTVIDSDRTVNRFDLLNDDDVDLISLGQRLKSKELLDDDMPRTFNQFYEHNFVNLYN